MPLGFENYFFHLGHSFYGIRAACSLFGEHDGIRTNFDGVGHVGDFRARRLGILDHGEQHLCRGNDWLARAVAFSDYFALDERDLFERDFEAEVAAAYHDRIRGGDYLVGVVYRFAPFYLCNDARGAALRPYRAPRFLHVFLAADVRDADILDAFREAEAQVVHVLLGEQSFSFHVLRRIEM